MNDHQMIEEVQQRLPEQRFEHILRVVKMAERLAKQYDVNVEHAKTAAILHDVCKFSNRDWMKEMIQTHHLGELYVQFHHELWHAPVGAYVAKEEFHVANEDVINAIRFHTTGRAGMSDLEKIIYIADLIEEGRVFPGVDKLREQIGVSLDELMFSCIRHSLTFLVSKSQPIFPDSFACYNELSMKGKVNK